MILRKKSKILLLAHTLNRSPLTLRYGGGERRAPLPVAGENHVIRWIALSGAVAPIPSRSSPRSATHRITWFSLASGGGARRPPPPIQLVWGRTFFFVILAWPKIPKCFVVVGLTTKTQNTVRFLPLWNSLCVKLFSTPLLSKTRHYLTVLLVFNIYL